jgi:probable H4MPT-linked C1 transfer pathway protein
MAAPHHGGPAVAGILMAAPLQPPGGTVIGWDIGGAHVKAAIVRDGRLIGLRQWPCPLWQGLHLLDEVLEDAKPAPDACHAVTMTGEMVDLFANREAGVIGIARHLATRLGPQLRLFCGDGDWVAADSAAERWRDLASANWAATAQLVAARLQARAGATLVDVGSTTTDLVAVAAGRVLARTSGDAQRLASGELLYQGVVRTPLCALAARIPFRGAEYNVMNEWFATTADVYRMTGELDPSHDQHPAADGGAKDDPGSCRRIARMIGHDAGDAAIEDWRAFARVWRQRQLSLLQAELERVESLHRLPTAPELELPLVGAGCGSFLVQALAQHLQRSYIAFHELVPSPPELRPWVNVCAPAVAVALLHEQAAAGGRRDATGAASVDA